jgi:hypothetical protein
MPPTFAELGVALVHHRRARARGITEPFEIQARPSPTLLAGRDVCGRAPTGSGKTLAFGIPLVATTDRAQTRRPSPRPGSHPRARRTDHHRTAELSPDVRIAAVYGGVGYGGQISALKRGRHPRGLPRPPRGPDPAGRRRSVRDVDKVVLDEADRMADMGFMPAVRRLLDRTRPTARRCCSRPRSTATSPSSPATTSATRCATRSARRRPTCTPPNTCSGSVATDRNDRPRGSHQGGMAHDRLLPHPPRGGPPGQAARQARHQVPVADPRRSSARTSAPLARRLRQPAASTR